jgi:hypothetical protein
VVFANIVQRATHANDALAVLSTSHNLSTRNIDTFIFVPQQSH